MQGARRTGRRPRSLLHSARVPLPFVPSPLPMECLTKHTCGDLCPPPCVKTPKKHPRAKPPTANPTETGCTRGLPDGTTVPPVLPVSVRCVPSFLKPSGDVTPRPCPAGQTRTFSPAPAFQLHCPLDSRIPPLPELGSQHPSSVAAAPHLAGNLLKTWGHGLGGCTTPGLAQRMVSQKATGCPLPTAHC